MTLATQIEKACWRFHLDRVVLVGDRGMITEARITEDIQSAGLDWTYRVARTGDQGSGGQRRAATLLFDQRDMASITAPTSRRAPGGLPQPRSRRRA